MRPHSARNIRISEYQNIRISEYQNIRIETGVKPPNSGKRRDKITNPAVARPFAGHQSEC